MKSEQNLGILCKNMQSFCRDIQQGRERMVQLYMGPAVSMEGGCVVQVKVDWPFRRSYGGMEGPIVVLTVELAEGVDVEESVEVLTVAVDIISFYLSLFILLMMTNREIILDNTMGKNYAYLAIYMSNFFLVSIILSSVGGLIPFLAAELVIDER